MKIQEYQDPRIPEGQARLAKLDGDIASLKEQIAKLENQKSQIQTELAKITGQAGEEEQKNQDSNQQEFQKNAEEIAKKAAAEAIANQGSVAESILFKVNEELDEEDRLNNLADELSDELVYYLNNDTDNPRISEIRYELREIRDELAQLELDQMEHEAEYDEYDELEENNDGPCWKGYEMIGMKEKGGKKVPNCVPQNESLYENYASSFRPGKMEWKGRMYNIDKVENVNDKMDIVYVDGKSMSSNHLESTGAKMVKKPRPEREKRMTKREYERTLKDVMRSLIADQGEIDYSIVADQAETLLYDPEIKDYLERRWKKENGFDSWYDTRIPNENELKQELINDLEMNESLSEAVVELEDEQERDEEKYSDRDYVIYVKIINDDNQFIGKIFKVSPDGEWYTSIKSGDKYNPFKELRFDSSYEEEDIIEFLSGSYDTVEIIGDDNYNEYIDDIEEGWPTNTL